MVTSLKPLIPQQHTQTHPHSSPLSAATQMCFSQESSGVYIVPFNFFFSFPCLWWLLAARASTTSFVSVLHSQALRYFNAVFCFLFFFLPQRKHFRMYGLDDKHVVHDVSLSCLCKRNRASRQLLREGPIAHGRGLSPLLAPSLSVSSVSTTPCANLHLTFVYDSPSASSSSFQTGPARWAG